MTELDFAKKIHEAGSTAYLVGGEGYILDGVGHDFKYFFSRKLSG